MVEDEVRTMDWKLRTNGVLEDQTRLHPQTDGGTEGSHACPVEHGQPDAVDHVCRYVVQHQRGGTRLQGEVSHEGVVGEYLHFVAGQIAVQLSQVGPSPADHGCGGV